MNTIAYSTKDREGHIRTIRNNFNIDVGRIHSQEKTVFVHCETYLISVDF